MLNIILIYCITVLIGIVNALKDSSALNKFEREWWNKGRSWKKVWKLNESRSKPLLNDIRPWYYLKIYKPKYIEKFPYSSTVLLGFTDGWHLLQNIQFTLIFLGKAILLFDGLINIVLAFIVMKTLFSISFEVVYKKIKNRR